MSLHGHQNRVHIRQRRLFVSIICMMSLLKLAAAGGAPFGAVRRIGVASSAISSSSRDAIKRSAFVGVFRHQRQNARKHSIRSDAATALVSGASRHRSIRQLSPVGGSSLQDDVQLKVVADKVVEEEDALKKNHFHCYLLRSTHSDHPLKTYIGFTTNPKRRLRQHNGELVSGARRTKNARPWEYVAVIEGFRDKVSAMQFEWAWQHVGRSKTFRSAVGCDKLAKRMKRRRGVKARLDELAVLLNDCDPFNTLDLKVCFPESEYHDLFCDVLREDAVNKLDLEVCSLDDMPFAKKAVVASTEKDEALNSMIGSSIGLIQSNTRSSLAGMVYGRFRQSIGSIKCNPLLNLAARSTSSWALNAVAEASTAEGTEEVKVPAKFKPYPFPYHKELTVTIESLTNLGFGIARLELDGPVDTNTTDSDKTNSETDDIGEPRKWVVFVPNVIPGELVRVRIYRNYQSYSDADLLEVMEPSPDRIEPKCSLATICGGCQYQHITIDRQRKMKTDQVQDLFERNAGFKADEFPAVLDTLGTDEIFGYRSKITPHYEAPIKKRRKQAQQINNGDAASKVCEIGAIGFKEKASRRLVDVPFCHIATSAVNDALVRVRDEKRAEARQGLLKKPTKGATLLLRDSDGVVETDHNVYVNTTVKGLTFQFQAGNFFQNNPFMLDNMVDLVVDAATKPSSSGKTMTHLIDCYCGSGLFALGSSSSFDVCVGIEVNDKAVEEARENAALNGIMNCDFVSASAEAIFQSNDPVKVARTESHEDEEDGKALLVRDFPRDSTVVVVDPPRKGCSEEFLEQLNEYQPERVVYMSCDPATQARDAKFLVSYGYEIVSIQPFDLFPQTRHIECLAVFEKKV